MSMGSLTLACVLLLANAGAEPEPYYMNRPKMAIPITIDPEQRNNLRELVLYCSKDEGKTWDQAGQATPEKTAFSFTAARDGKYWFTIQTVDKNGIRSPPDVMAAQVGQRIIVDTVKPLVKVKADRQGQEIIVSWEITEDYPNPSTFALEYHLADQSSLLWTVVPNTIPGATGSATFMPPSSAAVTVRLKVKDKAENEGIGVAEVPATATVLGGQPAGNSPSNLWDTPPQPVPTSVPPPLTTPSLPAPPLTMQQVSAPPPLPAAPMTPLRGALPTKQLVNKTDVKLDIDVTNLGPSGFGTVEVYLTTDEGANWTPLPLDPGAIQAPELRGPGQVRGSVTVHVPDDGKVFGYFLVVKSKAGLGKRKPQSGDVPHIRLERDMICPAAELNMPQPDPTRRDSLILTWAAKDKNLTEKPISLQWAPQPEGPWEFIGPAELPNTGRYAWQVPPTAPPSVFLKLTVRDGAGNVSVAQSDKPVLVDLSVPEVAGVSLSPTP
jgi:hypothetical protein